MLGKLTSALAVQRAIDEFVRIGRTAFLNRYGFGKSRDFMVRDNKTDTLCDSKAVVGAAYGYQYPDEGPLKPADFSGGEATVLPKLQSLGFSVVRIGEDWTEDEVRATVASYFEMLRHEAAGTPYVKSTFNAALRRKLSGRSKASVELKHQNISAVLHHLNLPFIQGYKPRGNSQLLLRQVVQQYVLAHTHDLERVVDALEDARPTGDASFVARLVDPPVPQIFDAPPVVRERLPRKIDFAARDEVNRKLGRAGEQWAIEFEQHRLNHAGLGTLFSKLDWVSDRLGDGTGYDIQSWDAAEQPRYIEVKTTNGNHASSFIISRNEVDFSKEVEDAFYLYRIFSFRSQPALYILRGAVDRHVNLEPLDYRASFRKLTAAVN
ncbi:MAG: hypothetical protein C0434_12080 [Xanthomonadaceae bacterium]|nr:hypothetical protein [Xanthomonadaceae bacterium]